MLNPKQPHNQVKNIENITRFCATPKYSELLLELIKISLSQNPLFSNKYLIYLNSCLVHQQDNILSDKSLKTGFSARYTQGAKKVH